MACDTIQICDTIAESERSHSQANTGWVPETVSLILWFLDEGQHRLPAEPFQLTPWQRVVDPHLFKDALLFCISAGPEIANLRHGTFAADLKRLHELFGGTSKHKGDPA
ncbi:MAG: hypothetical protein KJ645_10745 [Planctomycetes bacterium]|nr:hypothetical protein [Planctomycetota bacterium]